MFVINIVTNEDMVTVWMLYLDWLVDT